MLHAGADAPAPAPAPPFTCSTCTRCHHLHKVADDRTMRRCLTWMFRRAELGDLSRYQDLASLEKDGERRALLL